MDANLKAEWITALRSGTYRQGCGVLKNLAGEFCCLGVLCEIAKIPNDGTQLLDEAGSTAGYDPLERYGVNNDHTNRLWRMNDCENKTFDDIADYIEQNL